MWSGGAAAEDTSVSVVRWQQGEQTVAGWVVTSGIVVLCADISHH